MASSGRGEDAGFVPAPNPLGGEGTLHQREPRWETGKDQTSGRRASLGRRKAHGRLSENQVGSDTDDHHSLLGNRSPDFEGARRHQVMPRKRTVSLDLGLKSRGAVGSRPREHQERARKPVAGSWPEEIYDEPDSRRRISSAPHQEAKDAEECPLIPPGKSSNSLISPSGGGEEHSHSEVNVNLEATYRPVNPEGQENKIQKPTEAPEQEVKNIQAPTVRTKARRKKLQDRFSCNEIGSRIASSAPCKRRSPLWVSVVLAVLLLAVIATAVAVFLATKSEAKQCPEKWISTEGKCYYFSEDTKDWKSSQEFCSSKDASLALLKNNHILKISTRFKDGRDYWIGLRKMGEVGQQSWQWVDGSTFQDEVVFIESEGPELDCAYLNSDKTGNLNCASMRPWICVRENI